LFDVILSLANFVFDCENWIQIRGTLMSYCKVLGFNLSVPVPKNKTEEAYGIGY
jgi:hypothetical protein